MVLLFLLLAALAFGRATPEAEAQRVASASPPAASSYTNPVFDFDLPDPTIIRASDGWFYAYATQGPVGDATL